MLDAMMKFGAHRVDYLHHEPGRDPEAFAFYLRAGLSAGDRYSHEAKRQLYSGLDFINQHRQLKHLAGIYMDVDQLENLDRPAYQKMKSDMVNGMFRRVFVLDEAAIMGLPEANYDLLKLYVQTGGFELFTCKNGECLPLELLRVLEPLGV